jgi:hypothetical protein
MLSVSSGKNGLGFLLGHLFTNSSGHPGARPLGQKASFPSQKKRRLFSAAKCKWDLNTGENAITLVTKKGEKS